MRRRRRLYLMDDRYATLVAFLTGLAMSDQRMLDGFQEWVSQRLRGCDTNCIWPSLVLSEVPADDPARDQRAGDLLLDLLEEFLDARADAAEAEGRTAPRPIPPGGSPRGAPLPAGDVRDVPPAG